MSAPIQKVEAGCGAAAVVLYSYRQIYINHPTGLLWLVHSGLIYIVTLALAYKAIQQTGLRPKPSSVILAKQPRLLSTTEALMASTIARSWRRATL